MKWVPTLYKNVIFIIMIIIMSILAISSFFTNAVIPLDVNTEKTIFQSTNLILSLIFITLFTFIFCKFKEKIDKLDSGKLIWMLLIFDFILCMLWIVLSNTKEGADQAQVLYAAQQFKAGDFSKLAPDKYMGMYPFQLPLALLYEPFYILFGDVAPFMCQFMNAFFICGIQYFLYLIYMQIYSETYVNMFLLLQFFDLPIILYVAFVYGTIPGFLLTLVAFYILLKFETDGKYRWIILSCLCIVSACLLKSNNTIAMIALFIVTIMICISKKNKLLLLFIPLVLILYSGSKTGVNKIYEMRSNMEISQGEPLNLWIAMGLTENDERAAGWYNGYTWDTYLELECDRQMASDFAKESITNSLKHFVESPNEALKFFYEKIMSTWLNPDFQGLWNNHHHGHYIANAPVINSLYTGKLHGIVEEVLGIVQFLIYFNTLLYFIFNFKKSDWKKCSLALIFIGGFLFHLIWETKAQYVITYYVLLIPYASMGLSGAIDRINAKWKVNSDKQR